MYPLLLLLLHVPLLLLHDMYPLLTLLLLLLLLHERNKQKLYAKSVYVFLAFSAVSVFVSAMKVENAVHSSTETG